REVEHELAPHESRGDRGDLLAHRARREVTERVRERYVAAGDGGGARPAVGLQDLAVDDDAARAQRLQVDRRPQRAPDEALDLEGATAGTALQALAAAALGRGAREHGVLGGDPTLLLAEQVPRHALLDRREAQHLRVAERDARGAFGELRHADLDLHRPQRVVCTPVRACVLLAQFLVVTRKQDSLVAAKPLLARLIVRSPPTSAASRPERTTPAPFPPGAPAARSARRARRTARSPRGARSRRRSPSRAPRPRDRTAAHRGTPGRRRRAAGRRARA